MARHATVARLVLAGRRREPISLVTLIGHLGNFMDNAESDHLMERLPMPYTSPPNQKAFYQQVWDLVRQIPPGRVVTYGQVAQMLARPAGVEPHVYKTFGPRWVGGAMAACPDDVPWQRVINSQGKIVERPGAQRQRQLLEEEGIAIVRDRVDLKAYTWRGPGHEDEPRQARLF